MSTQPTPSRAERLAMPCCCGNPSKPGWFHSRTTECRPAVISAVSHGDKERSDAWLAVASLFGASPVGKSLTQHVCDSITQLRAEVARLTKGVREIAEQKTTDELDADHKALLGDYGDHDFEGAYDIMIKQARALLAAHNTPHRYLDTNPVLPPTKTRRITADDQPVFPCWLFGRVTQTWVHYEEWLSPYLISHTAYTHWHPDQPTAPTETPSNQEATQ